MRFPWQLASYRRIASSRLLCVGRASLQSLMTRRETPFSLSDGSCDEMILLIRRLIQQLAVMIVVSRCTVISDMRTEEPIRPTIGVGVARNLYWGQYHRRRRRGGHWGRGVHVPLKFGKNIFRAIVMKNSGIFWQKSCKIREFW